MVTLKERIKLYSGIQINWSFSCLLFLCCASVLSAQSSASFGALPKMVLSYKLNDLYQFNLNLESRQQFWAWEEDQGANWQYQYQLTDLSLLASRKIQLDKKLTAGYLIRYRNQEWMHRFIQRELRIRIKQLQEFASV
jgi:hypothetical protein